VFSWYAVIYPNRDGKRLSKCKYSADVILQISSPAARQALSLNAMILLVITLKINKQSGQPALGTTGIF
jgi:hypothetical protein